MIQGERRMDGPVLSGYSFRPTNGSDASAVSECVNAAYEHYTERIGMLPGPMTEDYETIIKKYRVTVAESGGKIAGVVVLAVTEEGFLLQNVAVHPSHRGKGLGKALLEFAEAEARRHGFDSIYLYTHEKMTENDFLYKKIGYVEYDRRTSAAGRQFRNTEMGPTLVYMRKQLGRP